MEKFAAVACAAAAEAAAYLREAYGRPKQVHFKGPIDLVTDTDRAVEKLVVDRLRCELPDHLVVGEESSTELTRPRDDQYVWYVDPLDGTTNFAHSYPQFCVSLALARGSQLLVGVVCDPLRDETFFAQHGAGATLNGAPIHVSSVATLDHALVGTGFPYDRRERSNFYLGFVRDFMQCSQGIRRAGSAALDLSHVACGRLDGFWEWKLKPWDIAAGALIVAEAGGRVSAFDGGPLDLLGEQTLASNGTLHDAMRAIFDKRNAAVE